MVVDAQTNVIEKLEDILSYFNVEMDCLKVVELEIEQDPADNVHVGFYDSGNNTYYLFLPNTLFGNLNIEDPNFEELFKERAEFVETYLNFVRFLKERGCAVKYIPTKIIK